MTGEAEKDVRAPERSSVAAGAFARPLRWLRRLALGLRTRHLPRLLVGKACAYLLDNWEPLTAHLRHSESRLDNNLVENAIRPSAIGKKNWLFIGHPDAGRMCPTAVPLDGS